MNKIQNNLMSNLYIMQIGVISHEGWDFDTNQTSNSSKILVKTNHIAVIPQNSW